MEVMNEKELIKLGFTDTSYIEEGIPFTEYTLKHSDGFTIMVSGLNLTEIFIDENWITVPNCKNITDVTKLIELFKLPF
jgi:hypothetical protein